MALPNQVTFQNSDPIASLGDTSVNTPEVDENMKPMRLAVSSAEQASSIARSFEQNNSSRNIRNAKVIQKYDGAPPFETNKLVQAGEAWKANFSTLFMAALVDRAITSICDLIHDIRYLTNSQLKPTVPDALFKSQKYREVITRTIRSWPMWKNLIHDLVFENVLLGYAITGWTDPYSWKPSFFRQEDALVPDGTGQHAETVQIMVFRQYLLIHEFADIFIKAGVENAKIAGWDIENCRKALETAMPENPTNRTGSDSNFRAFEDMIQEGTVGASYVNGARKVELYHLFVRETDGKISHWIVNMADSSKLFFSYGQFNLFSDVLTLYTLQTGNGKIHGSKGLGRMLYNFTVAAERMRTSGIDATYFANLIPIKADAQSRQKLATSISGQFIVIPNTAEIQSNPIQIDAEEFVRMDNWIVQLAQQIAGVIIPMQIDSMSQKDRESATRAQIDKEREDQIKRGTLARFYGQFCEMVSGIQRRMCDPGTADADAKLAQQELLDYGLTPEDIQELSSSPAIDISSILPGDEGAGVAAIQQKYAGDPRINQQALLKMDVTNLLGEDKAEELVIPEEDNTLKQEAVRSQILELLAIHMGHAVPISPRDLHQVHLDIMLADLQGRGGAEITMQPMAPASQAFSKHFGEHLQVLEQTLTGKEQQARLDQYRKAFQMLQTQVQKAQEARVLNQQTQQGAENGEPATTVQQP